MFRCSSPELIKRDPRGCSRERVSFDLRFLLPLVKLGVVTSVEVGLSYGYSLCENGKNCYRLKCDSV